MDIGAGTFEWCHEFHCTTLITLVISRLMTLTTLQLVSHLRKCCCNTHWGKRNNWCIFLSHFHIVTHSLTFVNWAVAAVAFDFAPLFICVTQRDEISHEWFIFRAFPSSLICKARDESHGPMSKWSCQSTLSLSVSSARHTYCYPLILIQLEEMLLSLFLPLLITVDVITSTPQCIHVNYTSISLDSKVYEGKGTRDEALKKCQSEGLSLPQIRSPEDYKALSKSPESEFFLSAKLFDGKWTESEPTTEVNDYLMQLRLSITGGVCLKAFRSGSNYTLATCRCNEKLPIVCAKFNCPLRPHHHIMIAFTVLFFAIITVAATVYVIQNRKRRSALEPESEIPTDSWRYFV